MLKLWQGRGGGSIIVSKSDPQHEMMQALEFKLLITFEYGSINRLKPGDLTIYRAADYLGNDSIYRCMRINDDTDAKYIELKKDRHFRSKLRQQNKIVVPINEVITVSEADTKYLACAACKRIFRFGNLGQHHNVVNIPDADGNTTQWGFRNIECCDKFYAIGDNPRIGGDFLVFCVSGRVFRFGETGPLPDDEKLIVDYLVGRKGAKHIERDGK